MAILPLLAVSGESIPEAWENSVVKLCNEGLWYKRADPEDNELQVDSTMAIQITNPAGSPLLAHKSFGCGFEDLLKYEMEILGAKDSWRKQLGDAEDHKWDYLYSERLTSYPTSQGSLDQLKRVAKQLAERPWTRRANTITWVPERDMYTRHTPCLQNLFFSIIPDPKGNDPDTLNMNYRFRSRNVMTASPMNMVGFLALMEKVRDDIVERSGVPLAIGSMVDFSDSYHISSRDQKILNNFMERLKVSKDKEEGIEDRSYDKAFVFDYFNNINQEVTNEILSQNRNIWENRRASNAVEWQHYDIRLEAEEERIKQIAKGRIRKL